MYWKNRLCGFWIAASFILSSPMPVAAEEGKAACVPVARAFERTICREEVTMEQAHIEAIRKQYEEQGLDSEEAMKTRSLERLRDIIWDTALERKFGADTLQPREEETALFSKAFRESLIHSHQENLKSAARIRELLASGQYKGEDERRLRSLLASIETGIAFYQEREDYKKNMPPEFHDMVAEAERGLAETMMRNWKINKALFEEYGGRLTARDGAIEPVDAYGKFLAYIRETGKLEIFDPAFKDVFREIELLAAAAPGEDQTATYKNYYSSPQWQFDNNIGPTANNVTD